jgi:anti-sigma-K factor RskA
MSEADDDKDVMAAEYALGTLDADGRNNVRMMMSVDPAFADKVAQWERRLGELHALVDQVEPPESSWEWIKARIAAEPVGSKVWMPGLDEAAKGTTHRDPLAVTPLPPEAKPAAAPLAKPASGPPAAANSNEVELARRAGSWRRAAIGASAIAAGLAAFAVFREVKPRVEVVERVVEKEVVRTVEVPGQRVAEFVAVFQREDSLPAPSFIMTVDIDKKTVSLRRVGANQPPDNNYELWIVTPQTPRPRSLGLVAENDYTVRRALADYDAPTLANATFGISLEPRGGSPTGQPTGPVIHGKLVQTTPATFPGGTP